MFITQKYMNQRSTSMIRKMKTDLGDEHAFERKIAKAIKDKKEFISKMTTPRAAHQTRNYSTNNPYASKTQKSVDEARTSKQKQNTIHINRQFVESVQEKGGFGLFTCINHPKKRGLFQGMQNRQYFYCHQCAIHLVKSNIQVVQISSESLIVKMFLEEQFEKIAEQEIKAKIVIEDYYLNLRDIFLNLYKSCHQSIVKCEAIQFGNFQVSESLNKMIESLGQMEPCLLKFESQHEKQNYPNNLQAKETVEKYFYKKDRSVDPKSQSNRSLEANPQKNASYICRSRENSFYKKGSKVEIPKVGKYDGKKGWNLR